MSLALAFERNETMSKRSGQETVETPKIEFFVIMGLIYGFLLFQNNID